MNEKQKVLNDVCFDKAGFGSKQCTLYEARRKDKGIKMDDIKEFFLRRM